MQSRPFLSALNVYGLPLDLNLFGRLLLLIEQIVNEPICDACLPHSLVPNEDDLIVEVSALIVH
jgi:hypothetical protein